MPVKDALVHRAVHHHIGVQRYALSFTGNAQNMLDDAQQAIIETIQSYADADGNVDPAKIDKMLADIAVIQEDAAAALENELESELDDFVQYEVENEIETLSSELPDDIDLDTPTPDELRAIISDVAFQVRYIEDWLSDFSNASQSRVMALIVGSLQGGIAAAAVQQIVADACEKRGDIAHALPDQSHQRGQTRRMSGVPIVTTRHERGSPRRQ
jgi:hypothetical protein